MAGNRAPILNTSKVVRHGVQKQHCIGRTPGKLLAEHGWPIPL